MIAGLPLSAVVLFGLFVLFVQAAPVLSLEVLVVVWLWSSGQGWAVLVVVVLAWLG